MPGTSDSFTLSAVAELATVIGALGVVVAVYKGAQSRLRATVLSRQDLRRRLDRMACGVTTDYVDGLFGPPPFRRAMPETRLSSRERIYRTRHAWLQVVAGYDGSVAAFSITVTDPRFKFRTAHLTFEQLDIRLGATRFSAVRKSPDGWLSRSGARRFAYAESHWFGNPGSYQVYVLGYNDTGTGHYEIPPAPTILDPSDPRYWSGGRLCPETGSRPDRSLLTDQSPLPIWLQGARNQTTANTLTVLGPSSDVSIIQDWPGVDGDQVRLLRQAAETRETRTLRRKIRKQMKRGNAPPPDVLAGPDPLARTGEG